MFSVSGLQDYFPSPKHSVCGTERVQTWVRRQRGRECGPSERGQRPLVVSEAQIAERPEAEAEAETKAEAEAEAEAEAKAEDEEGREADDESVIRVSRVRGEKRLTILFSKELTR